MYLPVEGGHFAELHLHLTDVDQELVHSIDVRDQDDLAFGTFGLYEDDENMEVMSCAVIAILIIMEVVNVKTGACTSIRERRRSEELHLLSKTCNRPSDQVILLLIRLARNFFLGLLRNTHLYLGCPRFDQYD